MPQVNKRLHCTCHAKEQPACRLKRLCTADIIQTNAALTSESCCVSQWFLLLRPVSSSDFCNATADDLDDLPSDSSLGVCNKHTKKHGIIATEHKYFPDQDPAYKEVPPLMTSSTTLVIEHSSFLHISPRFSAVFSTQSVSGLQHRGEGAP